MARPKSPDKRAAILEAAVDEITENGLGAATAKIARHADVATGTLFTYFASKEELLNELYLELKLEVYERINSGFPQSASLEHRARHVWKSVLQWAIECPEKRKVSAQLNLSDVITPETRTRTLPHRSVLDSTLSELERRDAFNGLPSGFAAAVMNAMQEATMDVIAREPRRQEELIERGFEIFWRAVR